MTRSFAGRAVVFDLDGTLLDSLPLVLAAIRHAIEPFGGKADMDLFAHLGGPPEKFMGTLIPRRSDVPAALRRMYEYHHQHHELIQPYAGAVETLGALRRQGRPVAVWTGRDRNSTEVLARRWRLDAEISALVCGDDLPNHKPHPDGLREILRRLGCEAKDCVMVGDADVDVLGAHACEMDAILIRHARTPADDVLAKARHVVSSPVEAYAAVLGEPR
ncbi:MAG: hypothetical protein RLZZ188_878 [Verrucomicrobiota bacterium]